MTRLGSLALLLASVALASCEKNAVQDITAPLPESSIKFFNFSVGAPQVNFYADDRKMSGVLSTTNAEATTGVGYSGVSAGGYYLGIEPDEYTFSGRIAATTDKDLAISNLTTTIEPGRHYSFYQSGRYNTTTKTTDAFIVEDPFIPDFDYSVAYVRFVNAIWNSVPMTLHAKHRTTAAEVAIGGLVPYRSAGAFTPVPAGAYDLSTRREGSATSVFTRTNVTFNSGRVYTITAIGDTTVTTTTAAGRPFLDNTANR